MKIITILFWLTTALVSLLMGFSGYNDLTNNADFVTAMRHLGYPDYLMPFLGVAKVLAILVLIVPKKMLIKHWAYAGICIDVIGAAYSHFKSGDGTDAIVLPLVALVITLISYYCYLVKFEKRTKFSV
jgi:DoxX-like family